MKISFNRFAYTLFIIMSFIAMVHGDDDDDDDILAEIAVDFFIGAAIEICSAFYVCHMLLLVISFVAFIIVCTGLCSGEIAFDEVFNCRNARRGGTSMIGRGMTRRFMNR